MITKITKIVVIIMIIVSIMYLIQNIINCLSEKFFVLKEIDRDFDDEESSRIPKSLKYRGHRYFRKRVRR